MKLFQVCEPLDVVKCNLTGSSFNDVNLTALKIENVNLTDARLDNVNCTGLHIHNANLSRVEITHAALDGMKINGILVTELFEAYDAVQAILKTKFAEA